MVTGSLGLESRPEASWLGGDQVVLGSWIEGVVSGGQVRICAGIYPASHRNCCPCSVSKLCPALDSL